MERGNFRGGRGGRGFGRGRGGGRGGRGGRGRGRGGRGGRGNFGFQQRPDDQGYAEGYTPPYPQQQFGPPQGYPPQQPGYPPVQQGYPPQPQYQEQYQPPYPQEPPYQQYPPQDQYQQPQYQQQGYGDERGGYNNGNPPPMDRYQPMDQPPLPPQYQQQYQPSPQYQPPPQQYQQFQETSRSNHPAIPQPSTDYVNAARTRQQAYAPVPPEDDAPEAPQSSYQEPNRPPPPSYQQPPLPPPQEPQGEWNYPPPPQEQQWQQPPPQQFPSGYAPQGPARLPMDQSQYQNQNQNPRFQDRRHDRNDHPHHKQHRPPPPSYICHNCNQPGHWKQHCPLFVNESDGFGSRQEDQFQQRYAAGPRSDQPWAPAPPLPGTKPQDPRRNGASYNNAPPATMENPEFAITHEPRNQPPLPNGPAPPLPPNSQPPLSYDDDGYAQQHQSQPGQQVWRCETCVKNFVIASQYEAHVATHVTCSDCDFSASKRVVTAHFQTAHGQYAGQGLKEIDVEGQKFMVLVGNSAEDIAKWREERRKKWLAMSRQPKPSTTTPESAPVTGKRKLSISSEEDLEEGEIEEDEEAKAQIALRNATANVATPDSGPQEPPIKKQRKTMLCKWFSRGHCRFDEAHCKYSHDRSAFGCRAMMYKGSCSKGMYCPFSHDTAVLSGQRERSQKASKERATEQQWRGEQKSLLRKLLAKDVRVEQRKMLQIVHFLVANEFLRSSDDEKADECAKQPAVKIEVLKSDEASIVVKTEASEPIKSVSDDIVMEEASDINIEQASTESNSATSSQVEEPTKFVADENVLPVVEAAACEQESQGVSKSPEMEKSDVINTPSHGGDEAAREEETVKDASSSANAESVNPEEVAAAVPSKDVDSGKEPAEDVDQANTLETSANEANEAC